ncbi:MAG TPA: PAS domain S-box protein [Bryobacteraceae bacterium]|nr:PAS domain S-box protein [Bryobacteraceae bacterium]
MDFPDTENGKLELLRRLELLNPEREECFDRVTRLACSLLKVPIALISFPDRDRYWFKSGTGIAYEQISKDRSFCTYADPSQGHLLVADTRLDPRFQGHPLVVSEPNVRFYASAPIFLGSNRLGTLCVVDQVPNQSFGTPEIEILKDLAGLVGDLIKIRVSDLQLTEAEAALRQSERHYRALVDNCPIGIYRTSVDGEVFLANPFILKMLGYYSLDELQRRNIEREGKVARRAEFKEILERNGELTNYRSTWFTKDGRPVLVNECAKAVRDDSGRIIYYEGTVEDITERSAAEAKLREQEERWELVVRANNDGIWDWNPRGHQTFYSDRYFEMLGYRPGEIAKDVEVWQRLVFPADFDRVSKLLEAHMRGETDCYEAEYRMCAKDGSLRWILSRGKAHVASDGTVTRVVGSHTDITERKRNEEQLRKVQEQYRLLFDSNPLPSVVYEISTLRILAANAMAEQLYGYTCEELLGMTADGLVPEDLRQDFRQFINSVGDAMVHSSHREHLTKDGRRLTVEVSSHVVDFDGKSARLATVNDVTEMIRVQDQLRRALTEATAAAQAKSNFLATMSHEIRTPMNGILGMASLLRAIGLTGEQEECVEAIQSSSEALLAIINDILDFSRIESGRMPLEHVEFDLHKMARDAFALIAASGARKQLKLSLDFDPHLPVCVLGDPGRVRQAFLNLLSNAVKFTEAGSIAVRVGVIPEASAKNICTVRFEVKDTGIGISAQTSPRLFEPFAQADASTTRRFGGTGLGLAISKNLVEMMGGQIGCESELGKGSTFWFVLPFTATLPAPAAPTPSTVVTMNDSGLRILLVEDNLVNQKVAFHTLRKLGHTVDVASGGREAIEAYRSYRYPLILMDANMPDIDGYETTRLIREMEGGSRRAVIIALTANAMPGDRELCLQAGMDDYIAKPIQSATLDRIIGGWVRNMESQIR